MKTVIYISYALGIAYLVFRRHLPNIRSRDELKAFMPTVSRIIYVGLAVLWVLMNKYNFFLSQWDAQRINVTMAAYLWVPALILLTYAILPNKITWAIVVLILISGWSLHMLKSFDFDLAHMNVKMDAQGTFTQMTDYIMTLLIAITFLYIAGPYIQKRNNEITAI